MDKKYNVVDVEVIGYKDVKITPEPTDSYHWDGLKSASYRVLTNKAIVIDLGHGREITIIFRANESDISNE